MEIVFKEESYAIVGACFEVYNQLGAGISRGGVPGMSGNRVDGARFKHGAH